MPWKNVSEVGSKEEKTQAKKLEEDLFPELYDKLNLSQFILDPEKGTVDIPKLKDYLGKKGFSEGVVKKVEEYLTTKKGDEKFGGKPKLRLVWNGVV